jgi:hypothetical protein
VSEKMKCSRCRQPISDEVYGQIRERERRYCNCAECGEVCSDYYMVRNEVWAAAGMSHGVLHLRCLEKRLGRDLTLDDFMDSPANAAIRFGWRMCSDARNSL